MLDAADPVRDLREVAAAQLLLVLHAERAVVGGDHRTGRWCAARATASPGARATAAASSTPTWRPRSPAGPGPRATGTGTGGRSRRTRSGPCPGPRRRPGGPGRPTVHDVQRRPGHLGQHDGPVGGLRLELRRPGQAVVDRVGLARGQRLRHEHVDRDAVLGVHHDHRAVVGRPGHGPQDLPVGRVEHARVGHEQLEAGDALPDAGSIAFSVVSFTSEMIMWNP